MKKFTAIMLAVLMIVSIMPMSVFAAELPDKEAVVPSVETNLESGSISNDYGLSSNIHDGAILHAWCWSFNTIKEQLPNIAEAGFTSVQTSPINQCKVGNGGGLQLEGCWYYQYQPTQYTIGNYQLGTLDEFRDLCNEADKYGIKIIVDVVANHCSSDYSAISTEIKNIPNAFHPQLEITSWSKRYQLTQGKLSGLWDLNTANLDIQNMIKNYLEECLEAGADGFRFDAAKHIELPDEPAEDDHDFKSDFWTNVLDNDAEFQYGEILQGDNSDKIAEYSQLMSVTASKYGENLRSGLSSHKMYSKYLNNYSANGADPSNLVTWVESHDNYCNDDSATQINDDEIRIGWALIASKGDTTPLFFARPKNSSSNNKWGDNVLGSDGNGNYYHPEVAAVNHFRNAMIGEDCTVGGIDRNYAHIYVQRGSKGVVIINFTDNDFDVDTATKLPDGEYTDEAYGRAYTVANGRITGTVKANTVAVIYDRGEEPTTIESTTAEATEELTTDASTTVEPTEDTTAEPTTEAPTTEPIETTVEPTTVEPTTEPAPAATYTVAGSSGAMFGTTWDATNTANDMVKGNDGVYSITYTNVPPEDAIQLKVVKNHAWDEAWGDKETGDNYTFNVVSACDVTVTFDPVTETVTVTGDGVTQDTELDVYSVIAVGNGEDTYLNNVYWDPSDTANSMTEVADGIWEMTMEDIYAFDKYNIKFAVNSIDDNGNPTSNPWAHNFGSEVEKVYPTGNPIDAVYNGKNCIFEVEEEGSTVKLQLDLREFNFKTKKGAKMTITVETPEPPVPTTTEEPTTEEPTTEEPTTVEPTTVEPTTAEPTTAEPTTAEPTTEPATTLEPTTEEPTTIVPTTVEPTTNDPTIVSRGTTGDCTWTLDDEGTLTISGNGAMGDYSYTSLNATNSTYITTAPWGTNIKNLVIESGVTNIGKSAFCGCTDLTNIDIPDSVTSIGNYAFLYCASLTSVDIPDSVKSIGVYAFYDCTDLTSVTIPDSVESIGSAAFDCCAKLIIYCNPGSYAESYANKNGRRTNITGECTWTLDANGTLTISGNGAMADYASINDNGNSITIHSRPWGTDIKRLIIENGVTNVGSGSIRNCTSLTSVAIPNSVTSIGLEAFSYCTGLTSISIPDNVTSIGRSAFSNCYGLTSVIIGNSVTNIGDNAFYNCNNLVIYGKENSYAQTYAQNNKITFVTIKECLQCHSLLTDDMIITDEGYPATCTQAGLTDGSRCSICGEIMVGQEVIPAKGHNETVQKGYPATCTETGLTDGSYCSECGLIFTAQEVIPATGHSPVIDPKVDPTCSHDGLTTGSHCENCGLVYVPQKVIARLEHTIVTDPAIEPDCIHTGLTEGSHCSACGEVFVEQQVVPALGHSYVMVDSVPATHFRTGFTDGVVCERCGEWLIEQEIVPKLDGDVPIGDINDDGTVDILDATVVQKYASGKSDLTPEQIAVADVNNDGVADILDASQIQKYAVDKISSF